MKYILFILMMAFTININAQEFVKKSSGGMSYVNEAKATGETVNVYGTNYATFTTTKGSIFIKCLSPRTGNNYPVWVGVETMDYFEGELVRKSKKGSLFILVISEKTGNPYPVWIETKT